MPTSLRLMHWGSTSELPFSHNSFSSNDRQDSSNVSTNDHRAKDRGEVDAIGREKILRLATVAHSDQESLVVTSPLMIETFSRFVASPARE
jgi:hypothetical protein